MASDDWESSRILYDKPRVVLSTISAYVSPLDDVDQEIAGKPFRTAMSSNEDGGVEDDSH